MTAIYAHPGIHKRALAKEINLSMPAVDNALKKMKPLIKIAKSGNRLEYELDYSKKELDPALALIEECRFQHLPKNVQANILNFIQLLPEKPLMAILFGSQAKMTATQESDIDILLIFQKTPEPEKIEKAARMTTLLTNMKTSPAYLDYDTFTQEMHDETKEFFTRLKKDKIILIGTNWWRNIENEKIKLAKMDSR